MQMFVIVMFITITKSDYLKQNISYYASSIALYKNRAYLALPRSSCYNNLSNPTLLEVQWNTDSLNLNFERKFSVNQHWGKCNQLQSAVSLDVEVKKGRLWVLDQGSVKCPPRVIVYSLPTYTEIAKWTLTDFIHDDLSTLVLDVSAEYGPLCYVGQKSKNKLIVFSFTNLKWCIVSIFGGVIPERIAVSNNDLKLYLTSDHKDDLFALDLAEIRKIGTDIAMLDQTAHALYVGKKLGPSSGLVTDIAGGLNYYLTRDYAVLRWTTDKPLSAENHEVLVQSYERFPYVSELFIGPQNNIWALVNNFVNQECSNEKERRTFRQSHSVIPTESSIVRLSKFVRSGIRKKFILGH